MTQQGTRQHATVSDLHFIVDGYYCPRALFWENVGNDKQKVLKALENCFEWDDVKRLVNQYI